MRTCCINAKSFSAKNSSIVSSRWQTGTLGRIVAQRRLPPNITPLLFDRTMSEGYECSWSVASLMVLIIITTSIRRTCKHFVSSAFDSKFEVRRYSKAAWTRPECLVENDNSEPTDTPYIYSKCIFRDAQRSILR